MRLPDLLSRVRRLAPSATPHQRGSRAGRAGWLPFRPAGRRFVVIIGNEGAVLTQIAGKRVVTRDYGALPDPDTERTFAERLATAPRAPVTVLLDVLEQHYRETTIPNVSWFDRRKVLQRKLQQAYGTDHLTSYIRLPADTGESSERRYLLIGVPYTDELRDWIHLLTRSSNPVLGLSLMPVELAPFARLISEATDEGNPAERQWEVTVTRERASGFRQVILYHGQLVFTRMTPNPDASASQEDVVETIESEVRSTMSYLRRLSYSDADRLDLTIIAESGVASAIQPRRMRMRHANALSIAQAADYAGVTGIDDDTPYADELIAGWFAGQRRAHLRLATPEVTRAQVAHLLPKATQAVTAIVLVLAVVQLGTAYSRLDARQTQLETARANQRSLTDRLDDLKAKLGDLDVRLSRFSAVVRGRAAVLAASPEHPKAVRALAASLDTGMNVSDLRINVRGDGGNIAAMGLAAVTADEADPRAALADARPTGPGGALIARATVRLIDPPDERERIRAAYQDLIARLGERLPSYEVTLVQSPLGSGAGERLTGAAGVARDQASPGSGAQIAGTIEIAGPSNDAE